MVRLSQADAAELVLREAARPMHRREITEAILARGWDCWDGSPGATPWESVGRAITQEIAKRGAGARFEYERKGSGFFSLRSASGGVASEHLRSEDSLHGLIAEVARAGHAPIDFICVATRRALKDARIREKEAAHERGYRQFPVQPGEFDDLADDAWDEL